MLRKILSISVMGLIAVCLNSAPRADPCGMVPPVSLGPGPAIKRVGAQKTYVFFKDGVESFVIRPGFKGKVDNFGMLIPFPTPPAIRKVPDNIFDHIARAVDPPEVVVSLYPRPPMRVRPSPMAPQSRPGGLKINTVRVLRQEAVGMYQVAVLEAGSAKALKRWMDRNGYKFPKGMDKVCNEYIKAGWCFVAVKTRVAGKRGVQPRPGMRKTKLKFPKGGSFSGKVQAMGFRFHTKKLVVPMRLSAFNEGATRNIVYLLTTGPQKIRSIPKEFVRRQISGPQLFSNVSQLLPLRVLGGDPKKIPKHRWTYIQRRRNPAPHNGHAKELFASDLLAVKSKRLALPHEEQKKVLLRIGERLLLRGKQIDSLNRSALSKQRRLTVRQGLADLKKMTLTVVDGDFPREVLARENLTFANYRMPSEKNHRRFYDAHRGRILKGQKKHGIYTTWQGPKGTQPKVTPLQPGPTPKNPQGIKQFVQLLKQLESGKTANRALTILVKAGKKALPYLLGEALEGTHLTRRGWSIVGLVQLGGATAKKRLPEVHTNHKNPMIVRTWSAAALMVLAKNGDELLKLKQLARRFPATRRPFVKRLLAMVSPKKQKGLEQLLEIVNSDYALRRKLGPGIVSVGVKPLLRAMVRGKNNKIRRMAAGYLGTLAQKDANAVMRGVNRAFRFRRGKPAPWDGGALFVPGIRWTKPEARKLVGNLLSWMVALDHAGKTPQLRQIHNNIRSLSLARAAGYRSPAWRQIGVVQWLAVFGRAVGCPEIASLLRRQRLRKHPKYSGALRQLGCY